MCPLLAPTKIYQKAPNKIGAIGRMAKLQARGSDQYEDRKMPNVCNGF